MNLWFGLTCLLFGLASGQTPPGSFPEELTLRVGIVTNAPFATNNNGTYEGFNIDLMAELVALASQDGVNLTFDLTNAPSTPQSYNDAFDLIAFDTGTDVYDIIVSDYFITAERYLRGLYSPAYLQTSLAMVRRAGSGPSFVKDIVEEGGSACITAGTSIIEKVAKLFPDLQQTLCEGIVGCIAVLRAGNCTGLIEDRLSLQYYITWRSRNG